MRVLIAGGGTGGHIYPALSIAKAIQEVCSDAHVEFVGTPTGLEAKLIPQAGYRIHFIPIGRLNKNVSILERVKTLFQIPFSLVRGMILIFREKPDFVLGVGGFASAPVVLAAALLGKKSYIWEPNAYPGLANRLLSLFVSRCFVVFTEAAHHMKNKNITRVHMPVRKEIEMTRVRTPSMGRFRILVFGGSQGARAINNALFGVVKEGGAWLQETEIVHQTGSLDFDRISKQYKDLAQENLPVQVLEYIHDMPNRYAWADLVISRSGTGTISELAACGKAALLIPLPTAADDHQTQNAQALVNQGGAKILAQKELTPARLIQEIKYFKNSPEVIRQLESQIRKFHKPNAAEEIVKLIMKDLVDLK